MSLEQEERKSPIDCQGWISIEEAIPKDGWIVITDGGDKKCPWTVAVVLRGLFRDARNMDYLYPSYWMFIPDWPTTKKNKEKA